MATLTQRVKEMRDNVKTFKTTLKDTLLEKEIQVTENTRLSEMHELIREYLNKSNGQTDSEAIKLKRQIIFGHGSNPVETQPTSVNLTLSDGVRDISTSVVDSKMGWRKYYLLNKNDEETNEPINYKITQNTIENYITGEIDDMIVNKYIEQFNIMDLSEKAYAYDEKNKMIYVYSYPSGFFANTRPARYISFINDDLLTNADPNKVFDNSVSVSEYKTTSNYLIRIADDKVFILTNSPDNYYDSRQFCAITDAIDPNTSKKCMLYYDINTKELKVVLAPDQGTYNDELYYKNGFVYGYNYTENIVSTDNDGINTYSLVVDLYYKRIEDVEYTHKRFDAFQNYTYKHEVIFNFINNTLYMEVVLRDITSKVVETTKTTITTDIKLSYLYSTKDFINWSEPNLPIDDNVLYILYDCDNDNSIVFATCYADKSIRDIKDGRVTGGKINITHMYNTYYSHDGVSFSKLSDSSFSNLAYESYPYYSSQPQIKITLKENKYYVFGNGNYNYNTITGEYTGRALILSKEDLSKIFYDNINKMPYYNKINNIDYINLTYTTDGVNYTDCEVYDENGELIDLSSLTDTVGINTICNNKYFIMIGSRLYYSDDAKTFKFSYNLSSYKNYLDISNKVKIEYYNYTYYIKADSLLMSTDLKYFTVLSGNSYNYVMNKYMVECGTDNVKYKLL